jgi:DNA polymerase III subunit gamma/tau
LTTPPATLVSPSDRAREEAAQAWGAEAVRPGVELTEILYRKWRPIRFSDVAGQEHISTTLKNALATGRVAHAYLFAGPRGTGKTTTGRLLAKALNCANREDGEPCNQCESCRSFLAGRAMDLIELDAASNRGIDEIRSLREKVAFAPGAGDYKVYLIDEVHMLTDAAFNALLKTLEEPPPPVVFVLATTEAHRLPATIASRCQRFDFRRAPLASMVKNLQRICDGEGIRCEDGVLELISRSATGSHRDAVNLLDQLATSYGNHLTVEHVRTGLGLIGDERSSRLALHALSGDLAGGLTVIASVRDDGLDLRQFQRELVDELRALLMAKSGLEPPGGATQERVEYLHAAVEGTPAASLLRALRAFGEADLKADPNSTLPLDIALAEVVLGQGGFNPTSNQALGSAQPGGAASPQMQAVSDIAADPEPLEGRVSTVQPARPEALEGRASASRAPSPSTGTESHPRSFLLTQAREHMRPAYERARAAGFQLGALLNSGCDIIEADESALVLGFQHSIHVTKASEAQNLQALSEIFSEVLGKTVNIRCVHDPYVEAWRLRQAGRSSPLVRAAQEMGGRILSSEPEDPQ